MIARARLWARDVRLAAATSVRGLASDPLQFLILAFRRLRLLRRMQPTDSATASTANAYRWFLADHPEHAAAALAEHEPRGWLNRRLARRLAVQLGLQPSTANDARTVRVVDLLQRGRMTEAAKTARAGSQQQRRILSELRTLQPTAEPNLRSAEPNLEAAGPQPGAADDPAARVLFVLTNSLPYTASGYTRRTHALLQALATEGVESLATTRIGYPTTIGHVGTPLETSVEGIRYRRLPTGHLPLALDERLDLQRGHLRAVAADFQPTVLHCTTDYTNAIVTRALADDLGLPWVYEMRGQLELTWVASRPPALQAEALTSERTRLMRDKETELAKSATAVIVLSQVQKADLVARGVPAEQIHVVPNGVNETLLNASLSPAEARHQLGLPTEGIWVGAVSSLVGYEGFDAVLHAISRVREMGIDLRGALVGDGVSRPYLMDLARQLGIGDLVEFPGKVPAQQAHVWHQALDVFCVAREDHPVTRIVTPLKAIEAMALGRPVVTSALPALEELVEAPGSGRTFPAGDANALAEVIADLAADPATRARLGQAGRAFARTRTWHNAAVQFMSIYRQDCRVRRH